MKCDIHTDSVLGLLREAFPPDTYSSAILLSKAGISPCKLSSMFKAATGGTVTCFKSCYKLFGAVTSCLGCQNCQADKAFKQLSKLSQLSQLLQTETVTRRGEKVTACGYKANFPIFFILVIIFVMANCH